MHWVTEVLIWKARYSVPTTTKYAEHFFHRLDNIDLEDAKKCIRILKEVFARTKKKLPRRRRLAKWDIIVDLDEV